MTPRELHLAANAYKENKEMQIEEMRQQIYLQALLNGMTVMARKKPPAYEKLFKKKKEPMSNEQMFNAVKALNAAMGGDEG
jgi:hypothetical protein